MSRYRVCDVCIEIPAYNERHDAYYCVKCDEWLDKACDAADCFYCVGRPAKPSQVTNSFIIGGQHGL